MNIQAHKQLLPSAPDETRVVLHEGLDAFLGMQKQWDALFARSGRPQQVFQSHLLLTLWARSYGELARGIVVVAAYSDGQLVAALPLIRRKRFGLNALQFMGTPIAQFDDMLLDERCGQRELDAIWSVVTGLGADYLVARRVREDSAFWLMGARNSKVFERLQAPFACLATRVADDGPGQAYSSKDRSNHRRRLRRLGERGRLKLGVYQSGSRAVALAMEAIAMKRRFLRRIGILTSAVNAPEFASFFAGAASDPASGLLVSTVELDGRAVAIDLSFITTGTGFGHVLATDPEFEREAVGNLLVHHVFESAKAVGAKTFDLLAPADSYKLRHGDGATTVESRIYPLTGRGKLVAAAFVRGLPVARRTMRFAAAMRSRKSQPPQPQD